MPSNCTYKLHGQPFPYIWKHLAITAIFFRQKTFEQKKKKIEGIEGLVDSLINAVLFKVHKMYLSFFEVAAKQVVSLELSSREQDPSTSSEIPR